MKTVTLDNLDSATEQEVFDTVVRGLKAQGFCRAIGTNGTACSYKTPDGLRCAAGQLITDIQLLKLKAKYLDVSERDSDDFDYEGWSGLVDKGVVPARHNLLICSLQYAHDRSKNKQDMVYRLRRVAAENKLYTNVLDA